MTDLDVRWKQRLSNYSRALLQLESAVKLSRTKSLSDLEKQGLIQAFEFTHELAWNVMKDFLDYQGASELVMGSRDATRESFQRGIILDGDEWMEMIKSRNKTFHTYNLGVAEDIVKKIVTSYCVLFKSFEETMVELSKKK